MAKKQVRTSTLKDSKALRKNVARMAKKWGWSVKEFEEYLLRMGVNRVMALERYTPGGKSKKSSKQKKATRKPVKKASSKKASKPRKPKAAETVNHTSAPAMAASSAEA